MSERIEALMRIPVGIITGIILAVWQYIIVLFVILNWFITIITGKRNKELYKFCHLWNRQMYVFLKYMTFVVNKRPFPFTPLAKKVD